MKQYLDLLKDVYENGVDTNNRTGIYARKVFGRQIRFDLREGFPLVTTKKIFTRGLVEELLWMLRGETNVKSLQEKKVYIWDEWQDETGSLGPIYGKQWRDFNGVDQIVDAIELLKTSPLSRRIIVNAWNPQFIPSDKITPQENVKNGKMALAPCHCMFQFCCEPIPTDDRLNLFVNRKDFGKNIIAYTTAVHEYDNGEGMTVSDIRECYDSGMHTETSAKLLDKIMDAQNVPKYYISCLLYIRSNDLFLGAPFNIASYALLNHIMADLVNMVPKDFIYTIGDGHIYSNHFEQVQLQLTRETHPLPTLKITEKLNFDDLENWKAEWFQFENYVHHPAIKGDVAI